MRPFPVLMLLSGFVFCAASVQGAIASPDAPPAAKPKTVQITPPSAKPPVGDPSTLSGEFWGDWKKTRDSKEFAALQEAVGTSERTTTAITAPKTDNNQRIVNLAIDKPAVAAKVMSDATAASNDAASRQALATVMNMVASPSTIEQAAPLVAPEAQARVTEMRADLSTGIPGLPGIYLGEVDHSANEAGERPAAPAGYEPVAGRSMGCPVR
ncbi:MAG: hypothetical protein ABL973_07845 [Micropepsaceae bacterium]